jgi:multiple sugar transport system permease protein
MIQTVSSTKSKLKNLPIYIVLILGCIFAAIPVLWMLLCSVRPIQELYLDKLTLPTVFTFDAFKNVIMQTDFPTFFLNSVFVAGVTTVLSTIIGALAGYSLSRFRFPGSSQYGILILFIQMFPPVLLIIPLFILIRNYGLLDTYLGLILLYPTLTLPFTTWMLRGFFDTIPYELEEAAMIDGASWAKMFLKVILPVSGPGIATVAIYSFILAWNEFIFAFALIQSKMLRTLPLGLAGYMADFGVRWDLLLPAATLAALPMLIFFIFMQRFFVQGLTAGAVKG